MRSKSHNSEESEDTGIDLAPMLDFVLNLLIFFIITTSFVKEAGISVSKPEALTAEHKDNGNILIAIRPNGDIWMDKRQVAITEIRSAIERLHIERPDDTVVLIADRESETGILTKVMDQVKLGGVADVSIATAPTDG
jgi:biopolymer transport protein ExbD